ncbi:MAG: hypothetical protein LQ342_004422 [Letrouitia transgressa]|nr:MAG: hypothetical protein LQ342_004422 [Letrouitia transgressa]
MGDGDKTVGKGTRRRKLAGIIKSANELRQSYQQSYGLGSQLDGTAEHDDLGMPGAFPNVSIFQSGSEEMLLFPSYAKFHNAEKPKRGNVPGTTDDIRNATGAGNSWENEWDRYEEANSIVDVDVRGWVYSPQKGQLSRYNRLMLALARRLSGIPAPSDDRASSPNSMHHARIESRHQQELVDKEAESIARKGEGEQTIAWQGGYSELPSHRSNGSSTQSTPLQSRTPSPRTFDRTHSANVPHPLRMTSAYQELDDTPRPGHLAKRASWNQPSDMTSRELNVANSHMMLRLKPFMTNPMTGIPLTVFFYNNETSKSRTIYTDERGHFNLRAALDFIPTNIRILASDKLSATEEVHIVQPEGVSLISDVDDTIKHTAVGAGAREVFRNVFIRDLDDLTIDGVKDWYSKMAEMGVKLHYVSNMPWQLFPVLMTFLTGAGLPKGSFHLKHYSGMLQGIFEPVAERKKGTLDRIIHDFPRRRFILVGDSGEADLELYLDIVQAHPGRVLGVFIRDVTTEYSQGFFDSSTSSSRMEPGYSPSPRDKPSQNAKSASKHFEKDIGQRPPALPPRQQTRSASTFHVEQPQDKMGKLIDIDDDSENRPENVQRSMTDGEFSEAGRKTSMSSVQSLPPSRPSKPPTLRGSSNESLSTKPPPMPPKPPAYRGSSSEFLSPNSSSSFLRPTTLPVRTSPVGAKIERKPAPPLPPKPRQISTSGPSIPTDPSPLSQAHASNSNGSRESSADRQSYRSSVRDKVSSVYNSLPSLYSTNAASQPTAASSRQSSVESFERASTVPSALSSKRPPPIPPRRNITSYPAAAAHYATNRFSGGWSGYNIDGSLVDPEGNPMNKKEEMWLQRWARAKAILSKKGVVLRSWRVGTDVLDEAVKLVEKAQKEEDNSSQRKEHER